MKQLETKLNSLSFQKIFLILINIENALPSKHPYYVLSNVFSDYPIIYFIRNYIQVIHQVMHIFFLNDNHESLSTLFCILYFYDAILHVLFHILLQLQSIIIFTQLFIFFLFRQFITIIHKLNHMLNHEEIHQLHIYLIYINHGLVTLKHWKTHNESILLRMDFHPLCFRNTHVS